MAINKGSGKIFEKPVTVIFYDHWFVQFICIRLRYIEFFAVITDDI